MQLGLENNKLNSGILASILMAGTQVERESTGRQATDAV
jgi:hypothetical protein